MVLGELTYQRMSGEMRFVRNPELVAYLNGIGAKLISHLPPTGPQVPVFHHRYAGGERLRCGRRIYFHFT